MRRRPTRTCNMAWSNETVIELLELLKSEPCIWNPKDEHHSNRVLVNDAWTRIRNAFSVNCTVEELKRKRNILLTQYRDCLKKIKDSAEAGLCSDEAYRPIWFAFDVMHSYLGPIYCEERPTIKIEFDIEEKPFSSESESKNSLHSDNERPPSRISNTQSEVDSFMISKRQRRTQEVITNKMIKMIDEACSTMNERARREDEKTVNECDLYGQLLAQKLKPLEVDDRLVLMNEIDNLVFRYLLGFRKRRSSSK